MRCETCQGLGQIQAGKFDQPTPCFECQGIGVQNCCEGLRAQPELYEIDRRADGWKTKRD